MSEVNDCRLITGNSDRRSPALGSSAQGARDEVTSKTAFEEYGSTREQMIDYLVIKYGWLPKDDLTDEEIFQLTTGMDIETFIKNKKLREKEHFKQRLKHDKPFIVKDSTEGCQLSKYFSDIIKCYIVTEGAHKCQIKFIPRDDLETLIDEFEFVKKLSKNSFLFAISNTKRRLVEDQKLRLLKQKEVEMENMNKSLPSYSGNWQHPSAQQSWHNYETVKNSLKK